MWLLSEMVHDAAVVLMLKAIRVSTVAAITEIMTVASRHRSAGKTLFELNPRCRVLEVFSVIIHPHPLLFFVFSPETPLFSVLMLTYAPLAEVLMITKRQQKQQWSWGFLTVVKYFSCIVKSILLPAVFSLNTLMIYLGELEIHAWSDLLMQGFC